ncbi:hypothetical protein EYF80_022538 [Liparis tanakae]|uniref:Uncharacterized protein n=1 Tax=Liparis tanakae TaxID=230148 RepID=A0A4Z2HN80_9TELE|nr:hypothetical protein EYF80_022538 [Liparis tanakae]
MVIRATMKTKRRNGEESDRQGARDWEESRLKGRREPRSLAILMTSQLYEEAFMPKSSRNLKACMRGD